jgi:hypothetical protein
VNTKALHRTYATMNRASGRGKPTNGKSARQKQNVRKSQGKAGKKVTSASTKGISKMKAKNLVPLHDRCGCGSPFRKNVCPGCRGVTCHGCDRNIQKQAVFRRQCCIRCVEEKLENAFKKVAIPEIYHGKAEREARAATIKRSAVIITRADVEKWKERTHRAYLSMANVGMEWGQERGIEILGCAPTMDKLLVSSYFIDRVDEGEGVAPKTAIKELTVWSSWYEKFRRLLPAELQGEHPVKNEDVNNLKKRAILWFQGQPKPKVGITIAQVEEFFGDGKVGDDETFDHDRLVLGICFFYLARSIAAAHLRFIGDSRGPVTDVSSHVIWGSDEEHGEYMFCGFDRDKTLRNMQTSSRYHPKENGTLIDISQYTRDYIKHYEMPSRTFLLSTRKRDGSFSAIPFTSWSGVVDRVCDRLKLDRSLYGTQSFRRGCAEWLNAHGLDFDQVGLLGNWLSPVVRTYTGVQSDPHLRLWGKSKASRKRGGEEVRGASKTYKRGRR